MLKYLYNKISDSLRKEIIRFSISIFIAWAAAVFINDIPIVLSVFLKSGIDQWLQDALIYTTGFLLRLFHFDVHITDNLIRIGGSPGVRLIYGCLGIRHFIILIVFISLYYGKGSDKFWYIPIGCIVLFVSNVIRIAVLSLTQYYQPTKADMVHETGALIFQWLVILMLILVWIDRFGRSRNNAPDSA